MAWTALGEAARSERGHPYEESPTSISDLLSVVATEETLESTAVVTLQSSCTLGELITNAFENFGIADTSRDLAL